MKRATKIELEPLGTCLCGKNIYVSAKPLAVAHDEPRCEKFDELEPAEFLRYVRRGKGIPDHE